MKEILSKLKETLQEKKEAVLVSIISSNGSIPRKIGSKMLITKKGLISGSVGGGAIEFESQNIAMECLEKGVTKTHDFSLSPNEVADIGMICGGRATILFQYFSSEQKQIIDVINTGIEALENNETFYLLSNLKTSELIIYKNNDFSGGNLSTKEISAMESGISIIKNSQDLYFCEFFEAKGRVVIFGGGHVAQALVPILHYVGFNSIVLDDREDFLTKELFPLASERILVDLSNIAEKFEVESKDYAVVMTRGHLFDLVLEKQLLQTKSHYIGVMGSRHKVATHREELKKNGFSEEVIKRLTAPIGLAIGAETPEELAISIVGQLIEIRSQLE